tara:strand:- start:101 stop:2479 length:2379 start_codon:yes stop_codon:yes gene_type:complete
MKIWETNSENGQCEEIAKGSFAISSPVIIALPGVIVTTDAVPEDMRNSGHMKDFVQKVSEFSDLHPDTYGGADEKLISRFLKITKGILGDDAILDPSAGHSSTVRYLGISTRNPEENLKNLYALNDNPNEFYSEQAEEIVDAIFTDLVSTGGKKLPMAELNRNLGYVNFFALSSGTTLGKELENALDDKMRSLGYNDDERHEAMGQVSFLGIGNVVRTDITHNKFRNVYIEGSVDLMADAFNKFRQVPPFGHEGFSTEHIDGNAVKLWADVPDQVTFLQTTDQGETRQKTVSDPTRHNMAVITARGIDRPDGNILPIIVENVMRNMVANKTRRAIDLLRTAGALDEVKTSDQLDVHQSIETIVENHKMAIDNSYRQSKEYQAISEHYGDRTAKRSGVPLMNHIHEGVRVLQLIGSSDDAIKAFCLHPVLQDNNDLAENFRLVREHDPRIVALAMEYRNAANEYLRSRRFIPNVMTDIAASPLREVNEMLVADKIQNYKDFMHYHRQTHEASNELYQYFKNWFDKLGIDEEIFRRLEADSSVLPEDLIMNVEVNVNTNPDHYLTPISRNDAKLSKIIATLWDSLKNQSETDEYIGDFALTPELKSNFNPSHLREAAVLIPVILDENSKPHILLTKRPEHMRRHKGEWVFPGGKMDKTDHNKTMTALRESSEEIGLDARQVFIIGQLPDYHVRSGFNVTPVIGIVREDIDYILNPDEVERIMTVPMEAFFMDNNASNIVQKTFNGQTINLHSFYYDGEEITGATAGMIAQLQTVLSNDNAPSTAELYSRPEEKL